jgi:putative RNA 2'-phosphotransferase
MDLGNNAIHWSKLLAYVLRHNPKRYDLDLDEEGWIGIDKFLHSMGKCCNTIDIKKENLYELIANQQKNRFEIKGNRIRALYGHSLTIKKRNAIKPPVVLYHGTSPRNLQSIMKQGLKSMGRQYVHLSTDIDTATLVGKRHNEKPVILFINSKTAYDDGVLFYKGSDTIWLSENMLPKYLEIVD